ncbi:neural cell adhesion molecule 1-like [Haliotis cracherodii]|uniref:neural cell adhesion molecule 1-like n=1 Tax=Haliotis cracherodii TaxID=6455 RepID=UPI0039EB6009
MAGVSCNRGFVALYVISPSGAQVLVVNSNTNDHLTLGNYTARVTYTGNIASDPKVMTFDLRSVARSDAGDYTCGSNGIADIIPQCGQKLVVPGQPTRPTLTGQSAPVFERQFTLTCSSTSTTVPADHALTLTYTWQRDNIDLTVTSPGSPYNFTVSSRDSHSYRCKATEGQGLESEWSQLYNMEPQCGKIWRVFFCFRTCVYTVLTDGPYAVTLQPSTLSYTRREGQESVPSILCSATCRPACTYKWFKDGTVHSDGATLTLPVADRSQTGSYKCQASNTHGTDDSSSVSVDVTRSPRLAATVPTQLKYAARFGGNVNVSVTVLAYPLPTFTWSRTNCTSQDLTGSSSPVSDISVTARLHLTNLQQQDFGDYSLTVDNGVGSSVTYTLTIESADQINGPAQYSNLEESEKQQYSQLKIYENTKADAAADTSTYEGMAETPPVTYESIRASPYRNTGAHSQDMTEDSDEDDSEEDDELKDSEGDLI